MRGNTRTPRDLTAAAGLPARREVLDPAEAHHRDRDQHPREDQLVDLLGLPRDAAWKALHITVMIGANDVEGETFTLDDDDDAAASLRSFATRRGAGALCGRPSATRSAPRTRTRRPPRTPAAESARTRGVRRGPERVRDGRVAGPVQRGWVFRTSVISALAPGLMARAGGSTTTLS